MAFEIKTEVFKGPLDLLLSLIEKRKLSINTISLAKVTDSFIVYLNSLSNFPIGESANFILVASTLLLIKSKSLLPTLELSGEEQENIDDLEKRLKEYRRIKELGGYIEKRFGRHIMYSKNVNRIIEPVFSPDKNLTLKSMLQAVFLALKNMPKSEVLPMIVVKKIISLEDMIEKLTERIKKNLKMTWSDFACEYGTAKKMQKEDKINLIVGFLAILELVKQGTIRVTQSEAFREIQIETDQIGTPSYGN